MNEMNKDRKTLYDLMGNYFYHCEQNGHSDFAVWCEDNLENDEQKRLAHEMSEHVNAIADLLFLDMDQTEEDTQKILKLLHIHDRAMTQQEEKYVMQWIAWGFSVDAISMAYEKTCKNIGSLCWVYMHKILARWKELNLLTAEQIR